MNDSAGRTQQPDRTDPDPAQALDDLRRRLDHIDRELLAGVRDRLAVCEQVAHVKQAHGLDVLQPGRMQVVHRRAADYAQQHGLSPDFVRALYDLLIAEACRVEDRIVAGDDHTDPSAN